MQLLKQRTGIYFSLLPPPHPTIQSIAETYWFYIQTPSKSIPFSPSPLLSSYSRPPSSLRINSYSVHVAQRPSMIWPPVSHALHSSWPTLFNSLNIPSSFPSPDLCNTIPLARCILPSSPPSPASFYSLSKFQLKCSFIQEAFFEHVRLHLTLQL